MQKHYIFNTIVMLFLSFSSGFAAEKNTDFIAKKSPLYKLLEQIERRGYQPETTASYQAMSGIAYTARTLLVAIAEQIKYQENVSYQTIGQHFFDVCNCFGNDEGDPDLAYIQPYELRSFNKKISLCNRYITQSATQITATFASSIIQFNQAALLCTEQALEEQFDFFDHTLDCLVYRPLEFVSEHKILTACCATVMLLGIGYLYHSSGQQNNHLDGKKIRGITLVQGDITQQVFNDPEHAAIVNAANQRMLGGGGIDGVIHNAAGPELRKECAKFPIVGLNEERCPVGQARITDGYNLGQVKIIHTVGPDTRVPAQNAHREELLHNAYHNSLDLAAQQQLKHIALPAISTGIFEYNIQEATALAVDAAIQHLRAGNNNLEEIRFVTFSRDDFNVYRAILEQRCQFQEEIQLPNNANNLYQFGLK